jgi:hypothetical protein
LLRIPPGFQPWRRPLLWRCRGGWGLLLARVHIRVCHALHRGGCAWLLQRRRLLRAGGYKRVLRGGLGPWLLQRRRLLRAGGYKRVLRGGLGLHERQRWLLYRLGLRWVDSQVRLEGLHILRHRV